MKFFLKRYQSLNLWVKVIFCFCLFGAVVNALLVGRDFASNGVLLRLHGGFFVLYASQVVFILLHERYVWVLTALQGVLALLTNADFTFVPAMRLLGQSYYLFGTPSVEGMKVYKYVFVSLAFTLQMLSAFALFSLLPKYQAKKAPVVAEDNK